MSEVDDRTDRIELEGFPLYKQETPMSCGAASLRMTLTFLGHEVPESEVRERARTSSRTGALPFFLFRAYRSFLREMGPGLLARMKSGNTVNDLTVHESLQRGYPVLVSYLCENHFRPGTLISHYSVIYGRDSADRTYLVANPFGRRDRVEIDRFWDMADLDSKGDKLPAVIKLGKLLGILRPRTTILVESKSG